ncbi:MAG TPA: hypothetical protein VE978_13830 [Chitinophagales bacterium]|nr:hypothetical protein [Chitinophagales bacterium]
MSKTKLTPEQSKIYLERWNLVAFYRGLVLNRYTEIEFLIEMIISHHFCADLEKANELRHRLICDGRLMTFETKWKLLRAIINTHYTDFKDKYPDLLNKVKKLQEIRNIVGHRKVLTNDNYLQEFDGNNVAFENFEIDKDTLEIELLSEPFNKNKSAEIESMAASLVFPLEELLNIVFPQKAKSE